MQKSIRWLGHAGFIVSTPSSKGIDPSPTQKGDTNALQDFPYSGAECRPLCRADEKRGSRCRSYCPEAGAGIRPIVSYRE